MKKNRLKEKLNSDTPTLATHLHNIWPSVVEVVGHTGIFDYVEFVAEYAPFDLILSCQIDEPSSKTVHVPELFIFKST